MDLCWMYWLDACLAAQLDRWMSAGYIGSVVGWMVGCLLDVLVRCIVGWPFGWVDLCWMYWFDAWLAGQFDWWMSAGCIGSVVGLDIWINGCLLDVLVRRMVGWSVG